MDAQTSGEVEPAADPQPLDALYVALTRGMEVLGSAGVSRAELTTITLTSLKTLPVTPLGFDKTPDGPF